jgi:hypothetical protein
MPCGACGAWSCECNDREPVKPKPVPREYAEQLGAVGPFGRPGSEAYERANRTAKGVMGALAQMPPEVLDMLNDVGGSIIVSVVAVPESEADERCLTTHLLIGVQGKNGSADRFKGDRGFVECQSSRLTAIQNIVLRLSHERQETPVAICAQVLAGIEAAEGL